MTARFARKDVRRRNCSPDDEKRENRRNSFVDEKTDSAVFRRMAEVRVFRTKPRDEFLLSTAPLYGTWIG